MSVTEASGFLVLLFVFGSEDNFMWRLDRNCVVIRGKYLVLFRCLLESYHSNTQFSDEILG